MSNRRHRKPYQLNDGSFAQGVNLYKKPETEPLRFIGLDDGRGRYSPSEDYKHDVWIRLDKDGDAVVSFYHGIWDKLGTRVVIAENKERLYFADERIAGERGYKITSIPSAKHCRVLRATSKKQFGRTLLKYTGEYKMEYDGENKLYYIDKAKELSGLTFIGKGATA